jgi:hypothetical protein
MNRMAGVALSNYGAEAELNEAGMRHETKHVPEEVTAAMHVS